MSRSKQRRISPASQNAQADVPRSAPAFRIQIHLSNADDISQRGRRVPVASSLNQINDQVLERDVQKNGAGRSTKGPGRHKRVAFPAICAQFSALPVEDRLQFLSWLFEGALSHCVSTRASTDTVSVSRCISSQDVDTSCDCHRLASSTELVDAQPTRKGLPWSMEENCLLVHLREEQNLAWSEVTRLFAQKFPGRSKGSLQVYWSTTLKKKRLSLADVA
jgi:hypothetical protein